MTKIYEYRDFPNPRRARIFLAEKGLEDIEFEQVDVPSGAHRTDDFLARNPYGALPVLELDDGSHIAETVAISRYFEEKYPEPALFGADAKEKAEVEMWQRRVEDTIFNPALTYYHHATEGLGPLEEYQNVDWGQYNRKKTREALAKLEDQLEGREYIAGDRYSIADITALCGIDFAKLIGVEIPASSANLRRWYEHVSNRPSAAA